MSPIRVAKNQLRQEMRRLRAALGPDEVAARSARAAAHVLALDGVAGAGLVALYAPIEGAREIETRAIHDGLRARGARVAYPVVRAAPDSPLDFHVADDPGGLRLSRLGIPQPAATLPRAPLDTIDVFVIPGLAFDHLGERLGWGGGHYDRTLGRAPRALRVGYAYEFQLVPLVPAGADDQRVDWVVTDSGARRAPPRPTRGFQ